MGTDGPHLLCQMLVKSTSHCTCQHCGGLSRCGAGRYSSLVRRTVVHSTLLSENIQDVLYDAGMTRQATSG